MKAPARWLEAALAAAALSTLAYFAFSWGLEGVIHSRKTLSVPDLRGRSIAAALDMLAPLNLGLRKEGTEFDATVAVSAVVRQSPPAGTVVRDGKVIRVVVSQGGVTVFAPNVVGMPLRNSEMLLRQGQLVLGEVSESYSLRWDKGVVLSQDPKAEASVERNSLVNLSVSAGVPPAGVMLMPDLLRKNLSDAMAWASSAGLTLAVSTDSVSLFPYGVILAQTPAADAVLPQDAKVSITISGRSKTSAGSASSRVFRYELSPGGTESLVRIVLSDKYGERELFNGLRRPGSKVEVPLQEPGGARVKIYLNGVLVEERDL